MEFDYIVIGGGSAGCVTARRLSDSGSASVALVEAGGDTRSPLIEIPALSMLKAIGSKRYDWRLQYAPDPSCNGRSYALNRGLGLGGSSAINGMVYLRGTAPDFDEWADLGNVGWGWEDVAAAFESLEGTTAPGVRRGRNGPLKTEIRSYVHPLTQRFIAACEQAGYPRRDGLNHNDVNIAGIAEGTQWRGRRMSAAKAFIHPVSRRPNLDILTHAQALRLVFEGNRVVGVAIRRGGKDEVLRCRREVILSAGAVMTPAILMRSGVGPAEHLAKHGIGVLHDSPGIGANLQEHAETLMVYETRVRTVNQELGLFHKARHGLRWVLTREGPVAQPGADALAYLRSDRARTRGADILVYFGPYAAELRDGGVEFADGPGVSFDPTVLRPRSRGQLRLASADPMAPPIVECRLMEHEDDLATAIAGLRWVDKLARQAPLAELVVQRQAPAPPVESDAELAAYVRESVRPSLHISGTCAIGPADRDPLDSELRVRGVQGVRVADTSVIPQIPAVNLNAVAMMIGERCGTFITRQHNL